MNSVLSLKSRRAQELGIHMEIQVGHMDTGQLQNMELCSLLGNLLDNAIDACVPLVPSGEPVILVNLRTQGRLLALAVENPWPGSHRPTQPGSTPPPKQTRSATAWAFRAPAASPGGTMAVCSQNWERVLSGPL